MATDATARLIALHRRIGSAEKPRAVPRAKPPKLIEADYARVLVGMVGQWRTAMQPLLDELPDLIAQARRYRADDTSDGRRAKALLERARMTVTNQATHAPFIARRYAEQAVTHQGNEFRRQSKAALGVELQTLDHGVPTRIGHFAHANAQLITSLGDETIADIGKIVAHGFTNEQTVDEIAAEINKRFDVAETYARFIARDQIAKLTAQVARMRHQEVGIATFRWKTRSDSSTRPSHAVKHDKVFPYEGSSAPSFMPGIEPGCRCEAVPVFDEIRMKAAALGRDPGAARRGR